MTVIPFPSEKPVLYLVEGRMMIAASWPVAALHEAAGRAGLGWERFDWRDDPPHYRVEPEEVPRLVDCLPLHGYGGGVTALYEAMAACRRTNAPDWLKGFEFDPVEDASLTDALVGLAMTRTRPWPVAEVYTCTTGPREQTWPDRIEDPGVDPLFRRRYRPYPYDGEDGA